MEPLFYNRRVMTPKHARELFRHVFIQYHLFYAILFLGYLALNLYYVYYYSINIIALLLLITIVIMYIIRPHSYAKKRIKEYNALHNAVEEDEVLFYEDYFITRDVNTKSELKIEYDRITKIRSTKNLYIFHIKNSKTRIITNKNMVNNGIEKTFEEFINSRALHSK